MLANKSSDDSFYENLTLGLIKVLSKKVKYYFKLM